MPLLLKTVILAFLLLVGLIAVGIATADSDAVNVGRCTIVTQMRPFEKDDIYVVQAVIPGKLGEYEPASNEYSMKPMFPNSPPAEALDRFRNFVKSEAVAGGLCN